MKMILKLMQDRRTWLLAAIGSILSTVWFVATHQPLIGALSAFVTICILLIALRKGRRHESPGGEYLKISTLERGQYDRGELILHAVFQVLVDFLEKEKPKDHILWSSDDDHQNAWSEMQELYTWWKQTRPQRTSPLDEVDIPDDYMFTRPVEKTNDDGGTFVVDQLFFREEEYPEVRVAFAKGREFEEWRMAEDQANLHRLVKIRPFMWV